MIGGGEEFWSKLDGNVCCYQAQSLLLFPMPLFTRGGVREG